MAHHKIKLADHRERKDKEGRIEIELSNGDKVTVPAPELWSDDVLRGMVDGTLNDADLGPAVMGEDAYAKYVADGGTAIMLAGLVQEFHGEILGK